MENSKQNNNREKSIETRCLHLDEENRDKDIYGAVSFPIYQTATFAHPAVGQSIHSDIVFSGKHTVFADIKEEFKNITITCTSPSKTFNIAGLQVSNIFIPNRELKSRFKKELDAAGYSQLNSVGLKATEAAYRYGGEWYQAMLKYVKDNIDFTKKFIEDNIPKARMANPEGTYLVWIDFKGLGLSDDELNHRIIHKAKLWLDSGAIFGKAGEGFQRINVACPRKTLETALKRLAEI